MASTSVRHQTDVAIAGNVRAEIARTRTARSEVAGALGISTQALSCKLNGKTRFSAAELVAVAAHLGVPVETLTDGAALAAEPAGGAA